MRVKAEQQVCPKTITFGNYNLSDRPMSVERIAVATAVISAAISAAGLLLAWYRGSTAQRPMLARTLGGFMVASTIALILALAFAGPGNEDAEPVADRSLSADDYRLALIGTCDKHQREAERIERAEGDRPVFGSTVQLEKRITDELKKLRPPKTLEPDHRRILELWLRRVSLLGHYYDDHRQMLDDPNFRRDFQRAIEQIDFLTQGIRTRFVALGVTPECDVFD